MGPTAAVFVCRLHRMKLPIFSRRGLLVGTGIGAGTGLLPLTPLHAKALVPTPAQTEGPFYPTGFPADMDNDLVQVRGAAARARGQVLHLQGRVLGVDGSARPGALAAKMDIVVA